MAMETQPMPLDALSKLPGGLDDFRISAPSEVHSYLKQLCNGNVLLNLVGSEGTGYMTTVWAVDSARNVVCFSADASDPDLQRVLASHDVVAVGYLDNIKLQFDVSGLVVTRSGKLSALNARIPHEMFRFQRRDAYRVRPLPRSAPVAHMRRASKPDEPIELRVLDLSISGCSLLIPQGMSAMEPGTVLEGVHIDLDGSSTMRCNLLLHHVSDIGESQGEAQGSLRIGCEMLDVGQDSLRALQRFIDYAQQRRRHSFSL